MASPSCGCQTALYLSAVTQKNLRRHLSFSWKSSSQPVPWVSYHVLELRREKKQSWKDSGGSQGSLVGVHCQAELLGLRDKRFLQGCVHNVAMELVTQVSETVLSILYSILWFTACIQVRSGDGMGEECLE